MRQIQETAEMSPWTILLNPSGSGEKLHLASFPLRPEDLQDTGGSNALQDSTCVCVYIYALYVHVCLPHQAEYI